MTVQIGDVYIDKDVRMFNRALKVLQFEGERAVCVIGYISNHEYYSYRSPVTTKIKTTRLETGSKFKFWGED